jgi:hypothetical protein
MNEYKNYAVVVKGKVLSIIRTPIKPKSSKTTEVLELTDNAFCDLAYNRKK